MAEDLIAGQHDIIIASYEFVESSYCQLSQFEAAKEVARKTGSDLPKRPVLGLHSKLYEALKLSIKLLVLDEAHVLKNEDSKHLRACLALLYSAALPMAGTAPANSYLDIVTSLLFIQGQPLKSKAAFLKAFAPDSDPSAGYKEPNEPQTAYNQKYLRGLVVSCSCV